MSDRVRPCLWFRTEAEEAARFYASLVPNSRVTAVHGYTEAGPGPKGDPMLVEFELDGRPFLALNGKPELPFNHSVSISVDCEDQATIDRLWHGLGEGGAEVACGWLTDRYGLSWQIVPAEMGALLAPDDPAAASRVMAAMMGMVKLDLAALRAARAG